MWDNYTLLFKLANALLLCAVLCLGFAGVRALLDSSFFPVRTMVVEGKLEQVTQEQLRYVMRRELKGTFFTLNMDMLRQSFEKLPWVKRVHVYRRWPDRLAIHVEEYDAVARWDNHGLIDVAGVWFDAATNESLPIFMGQKGSEKKMAAVLPILKRWIQPLALTVSRLTYTQRGAWKVVLSNNVALELGRCNKRDFAKRIERFAKYWPDIVQKNPMVRYVDLRYADGFAINGQG